jgi:hypothetical protein
MVLCYSYVVASLFLTIFSFSARTILHCFLLDEETGKSINTPECLEAFLAENDKQPKSGGGGDNATGNDGNANNKMND